MVEIHDPGNEAPVNTLYAWLSVDENGNEGIVGGLIAGMGLPLVTGKEETARGLYRKAAIRVAEATGKRVRLVSYTRGPMIEERQ